jgi:hypothetical protein
MRDDREDTYLDRMRQSLPVSGPRQSTRVKVIGTATALGLVLLLAALRQFGTREPITTSVTAERTVFGGPQPALGNSKREIINPETTKAEAHDRQPTGEQGTRARSVVAQPTTRRSIGKSNLPGDLHVFLDRWRSTLISGDAGAQADLYANKVDRFFTKRNVSRDEVRREKERLLGQYPEFYRYEIGDVRVESMDGNRAVVSFRKDWDARGRGRFAGSERQRLTLRRESGSWKIVGEEETKVYWVRRS